jgi:hypothetical protein
MPGNARSCALVLGDAILAKQSLRGLSRETDPIPADELRICGLVRSCEVWLGDALRCRVRHSIVF